MNSSGWKVEGEDAMGRREREWKRERQQLKVEDEDAKGRRRWWRHEGTTRWTVCVVSYKWFNMKVEEVDGLGALGMLSIVNDDNMKVEEEDDFEVTIANKCTHACMCAHTREDSWACACTHKVGENASFLTFLGGPLRSTFNKAKWGKFLVLV